jgi:hypothetical protein
MSIEQHDSGPTSNDLLRRLIAKHAHAWPAGPIVAESALLAQNDVENIDNATAAETSSGFQAPE